MSNKEINFEIPSIDLRREIHFEHSQIGQRMGWYASSQAFMFTAYTLSGNYDFKTIPKVYLPTLGMLFSVLAFIAIVMAVIRITQWVRKQPPEITFNPILHSLALLYPLCIPIAIGFVWFKLLCNA